MSRYTRCALAYVVAFCTAVLFAGHTHAMAAPQGVSPEAAPAECNCVECGMRVKPEGLFASQMVFKAKKTAWFCDLGDMMLHYDGLKDKGSVAAIYVKDYASGDWTDGTKAYYLTGSSVRTPMSYGIIAFKDKEAAERFMADSGGKRVVGFDEAIASGVFRE